MFFSVAKEVHFPTISSASGNASLARMVEPDRAITVLYVSSGRAGTQASSIDCSEWSSLTSSHSYCEPWNMLLEKWVMLQPHVLHLGYSTVREQGDGCGVAMWRMKHGFSQEASSILSTLYHHTKTSIQNISVHFLASALTSSLYTTRLPACV